MYGPEDEKLFRCSAEQQSRFTALALPLLFETREDEFAHPQQVERPAISGAEVVELDDEENAVRAEASLRVELCLEKGPSLVYEEGRSRFQNLMEWAQ